MLLLQCLPLLLEEVVSLQGYPFHVLKIEFYLVIFEHHPTYKYILLLECATYVLRVCFECGDEIH